MHSERVNELEWNNRPIKVFIELTECGNVDTEVKTYQLLPRSQARLLFMSASTALLSWTIFLSSIVVLKCVFIILRQMKDLPDATDVTGIVQAICRSLLSSLKASSYLETKLQNSRSVEVFSPNTGIVLSTVLRSIIRFICFNSSAKTLTFDLYCSANFVMELYSRNWPETRVRASMPHIMLPGLDLDM